MKLKSFPKGGIHPPHRKVFNDKDYLTANIPSIALVPLSQHIGAPAQVNVKVGDCVKEDDLIGIAQGFVSSNIHSPVTGEVIDIKKMFMPNGKESEVIVIQSGGEFTRTGKAVEPVQWKHLSKEDIISKVKDLGIVGLGGATFPTHVKLSIPMEVELEHLIINGAECEPYLSSDHTLLMENPVEILEGLKIIDKVLAPKNVSIGVEENKKVAALEFQKRINESDFKANVILLKNKYPQGAEKNLVQAILGKEIPSGKLPISVGVVNLNISTVFSIYEAVCLNRPLVERFVTIGGGAIKNPGVYKVRVGKTVKDLIDECGGFSEDPVKILFGGPMMGFPIFDLETPITKGTSGILALTKKEIKDARTTNCLKCGRCVDGCPMGLMPSKLYKFIDHNSHDSAVEEGLLDCVECGSCAYNCPAHIPLVQQFRSGKSIVRRSKGVK